MTRRGWLAIGLALLACYLPHVLWGEFVYEDVAWIGAIGQGWTWRPRGLSRALWTWQWQLHPSPVTVHAVSVGLHVVVAGLASVFARRLGLTAFWWLARAIVLLHPLGVETVAYGAQQGELIAAIGVLGACILATGRWWRPSVWSGIALCLAFGLLGKESAVVGLWLVPLTIVVTGARTRAERPLYASLWLPFVLALELTAGAGMSGNGWSWLVNVGESAGVTVTALDWLLAQSAASVRTLGLLILPFGLTVDYDYDVLPMAVRWCALGVLVILPAVVWRIRRRWPIEAFCLAALLVVILPRLIVQTPRSNLNDHHAYLFLPFFGVMVASIWKRVAHDEKPLASGLDRDPVNVAVADYGAKG